MPLNSLILRLCKTNDIYLSLGMLAAAAEAAETGRAAIYQAAWLMQDRQYLQVCSAHLLAALLSKADLRMVNLPCFEPASTHENRPDCADEVFPQQFFASSEFAELYTAMHRMFCCHYVAS